MGPKQPLHALTFGGNFQRELCHDDSASFKGGHLVSEIQLRDVARRCHCGGSIAGSGITVKHLLRDPQALLCGLQPVEPDPYAIPHVDDRRRRAKSCRLDLGPCCV